MRSFPVTSRLIINSEVLFSKILIILEITRVTVLMALLQSKEDVIANRNLTSRLIINSEVLFSKILIILEITRVTVLMALLQSKEDVIANRNFHSVLIKFNTYLR